MAEVAAAETLLPVARQIVNILLRQQEIVASIVEKQTFMISIKNALEGGSRLSSTDLTKPQASYDLKRKSYKWWWCCCCTCAQGACGQIQGPLLPVAPGESQEWVVKSRYGSLLGVCGTLRYPILNADGSPTQKSLFVFFNSPEGYLSPSLPLKLGRWLLRCFGCESRTDYEAHWNALVVDDGDQLLQDNMKPLLEYLWNHRISFQPARLYVDQTRAIVTNEYKVVGKLQVFAESVSLVVQISSAPDQAESLPAPVPTAAKEHCLCISRAGD